MLLFNMCEGPKKIWHHFGLFLSLFLAFHLKFLQLCKKPQSYISGTHQLLFPLVNNGQNLFQKLCTFFSPLLILQGECVELSRKFVTSFRATSFEITWHDPCLLCYCFLFFISIPSHIHWWHLTTFARSEKNTIIPRQNSMNVMSPCPRFRIQGLNANILFQLTWRKV